MSNLAKSYQERARVNKCIVARDVLSLMDAKKTNLCASVDVRTTAEMLNLLDKVGPHIVMAKTHMDIIDDFQYEKTILGLKHLADKHNFLIFEDRKFADIGSTVKAQYSGGAFKTVQWADITNAHTVPGPGIIKGLLEAAEESGQSRGLLLLAELSSQGSLAVDEYTRKSVQMARSNRQFVFGFIAQQSLGDPEDDFLILTPGVSLDDEGDNLGQQYRSVDQAISSGSDVIIVGRGLFGKGRDPEKEAQRYREAGWNAYLNRIGKDSKTHDTKE